MLNFSIMGYSLRKSKNEDNAYDLCYKKESISRIEAGGDTKCVDFKPETIAHVINAENIDTVYVTLTNGVKSDVVRHFREMLDMAESRGLDTHLLSKNASTEHGSCAGFACLLKALILIVTAAGESEKISADKGYKFYGVALFGSSWFNPVDDVVNEIVHGQLPVDSYDVAATTFLKSVKSRSMDTNLKVQALALLSGKFDWNLSKEDYFELFATGDIN